MSSNPTRVVNLSVESYSVYIGRRGPGFHFGNPFSHKLSSIPGIIKTKNRNESVRFFREWLCGDRWEKVEPERRVWILNNLESLRGKVLGCFCKPKICHGDVLVEFLDGQSILGCNC